MKLPALCSILILAGVLGGCISPSRTVDQAGHDAAEEVAQTMGIVDDPTLTAYVQKIGERLAAHTDDGARYRFLIVNTPEPNAFALPGGHIYVSRGLLALINSEDELAGVLGHEIGHIDSDHALKRVSVAAPFSIVSGLAGFATGIVSPSLGRAVAGSTNALSAGLVVAPFSRRQEREADKIGIRLAAASGWDPMALSRFLETLERDEALDRDAPKGSHFVSTHPSTPERVADTAERARETSVAPRRPIAADRDALLSRLEGLLVGADPAGGVFLGTQFLHPEMELALTFPEGWETRNAASSVAALSPDEKAVLVLEIAGSGNDPWQAQREAQQSAGRALPSDELQVGGLKAVRARADVRTSRGVRSLDVTWIALGGTIFQISGVASPDDMPRFERTFRSAVESFHPLTTADRKRIEESRLRIVSPAASETLGALVTRTGSDWSAEKAAVANAVETGRSLEPGLAIKVSIPQRYSSGS